MHTICLHVLCRTRWPFIQSFSCLGYKLRLILDEMCHLYRKFMSCLRRLLYKMRLIFPHINGLLSSYVPQILLQPVRIIARKFANRLVPHTAVHLHTFLLWNNHNQYKNRVQLFVVPAAYHHTHFLLYGASTEAKLMSKQLLCELHFAMPTTLLSRVLSVHHKVQFTLTTCARRPIVLPHLNNCHFQQNF